MDAMGEADEFAADEDLRPVQQFLTPEARAFTGAGLVLAGLLSTSLFQFLSFFLINRNDGSMSPALQYGIFAGPSGVMAAAGAAMAWPTCRTHGGRMVHGLAVATVVVGSLIALAVAAGIIAAAAAPEGTF